MPSPVLLLFTLIPFQGEPAAESAPASQPASAPASRPAVRVLDETEAKASVARFEQVSRKKLDLGQKMQAVEQLADGAHPRIVRALDGVLKRELLPSVRLAAARALADQPAKESRRVVVAALKDKKNAGQPQVLEALVRSLERTGYDRGEVELLTDLFTRGDPSVQKAVVACFGAHAEKDAVELLVDNLDEPAPADPNAADNPPAEYWEKRYKAWKVWNKDVRAALQTITGQDFQNSEQARKWLRRNAAGIGITRW